MNWEHYFIQGFELIFLGVGSYFDMKNRELPIEFLGAFAIFGIVCNVIWKYQSLKSIVIGCSIGILFLLIGKVTNEAIGYGDGVGLCILGIFEGWEGFIPIAFGAFCLSAVYGLWKIIGFKQCLNDTMPFYPFLFMSLVGVIIL